MGASGPMLRGSGVAYDVRKAFPYSSYEEFDFNMQTQTAGDCYARYQVRVAEIRESIKIVRQAMEKIPAEGPIKADAARNHSAVARRNENLDRRARSTISRFSPKVLRRRRAKSTRRSNRLAASWDFSSPATARRNPYRVKVRAPSFVNLQSLPKLCEGRLIADVVACIGTTDIVLGEVDR